MSSKLTKSELTELIHNVDTFVNSKRYGYSIDAVMERYPDGCPDNIICQLLDLDSDTLDELYAGIIVKLRKYMGVEEAHEELRDPALSSQVPRYRL